jgi:tryptophanase
MMESYRIRVVEPTPLMTGEEALAGAHDNLFDLRAGQVPTDLLGDSGTGALPVAQLAAAMTGVEPCAGDRSLHRFRAAVEEITSSQHILPLDQGRAGERILFSTLLEPGQIALSNTPFEATRTNKVLEEILDGFDRDRVALVIVTITNSGGSGQPASMGVPAAGSRICQERRVPLFLDAARFAGNAWLVREREPEFRDWSPRQVAEAAFRLVNGCVASMKKDGPVNMGGFLALRDEELARPSELLPIAIDWFPTYGRPAGRNLDMAAQGLVEEDGDAEPLVAAPCGTVRLAIPGRVDTQTQIEYVGRDLVRLAGSTEKRKPVPIRRAGSWTGIRAVIRTKERRTR